MRGIVLLPRERLMQRAELERMLDQPWMHEDWFAREFRKAAVVLERETTLDECPAIERNLQIVRALRASIPSEHLGTEHKEAILAGLYYRTPDNKLGIVPKAARPLVKQANAIRATVLASTSPAEVYHKIADADSRAALVEVLALTHAKLREIPNEQQRQRLAQVAADIYAPLTEAIGLRRYKEMLEESAFRVFNYGKWREIHDEVKKHEPAMQATFGSAEEVVLDAMRQLGLVGHVERRSKSEHSIHRKMEGEKHASMREVMAEMGPTALHDFGAVRAVIHGRPINSRDPSVLRPATEQDCYALSQAITSHPDVKNLVLYKDYIAKPKPVVVEIGGYKMVAGDYRSWHGDLWLKKPKTMLVELQIRTNQMHQEAETGNAANWLYKGHALPKRVVESLNALARRLHAQPLAQKQSFIQVKLPGDANSVFPTHATVADAVYRILGNSFGAYPFVAFVDGRRARGPLEPLKDGTELTVRLDPAGAVPNLSWVSSLLPETAQHVHRLLRTAYKERRVPKRR
ncbi:MAG: hypothetical protein AB1626_00590 [Candidatus Micrarchaeota archaeon]